MGYRSDVAYMIRGPKDTMLAVLAHYRLTVPHAELALDEVVISEGIHGANDEADLTIGLKTHGKWYDDYEDVKCHENLWRLFLEAQEAAEADSDAIHIDGRFIRIGENTDDIEVRTFGNDSWNLWEELDVSVSLNVDTDAFNDARDIHKEAEQNA
jgi:hypothetical protein